MRRSSICQYVKVVVHLFNLLIVIFGIIYNFSIRGLCTGLLTP
jgi:hypothetical protein